VNVIYGPDGGVLSVVGEPDVRACKICGCTDEEACVTPSGPCMWVYDDLCSACAGSDP